MLNRRYYPEIKMAFSLWASQRLGWAIKRGEDRLRGKINEFFRIIMEDGPLTRYITAIMPHGIL
jgi:membrane-bound lytic murein transglycosylase F